jgi:hypothetical protein
MLLDAPVEMFMRFEYRPLASWSKRKLAALRAGELVYHMTHPLHLADLVVEALFLRDPARAREIVKSSLTESRARKLIALAGLPIQLTYCAADTTRWAGTGGMNFQNLPRDSKIRRCLMAPKGHRALGRILLPRSSF